MLKTFSKGGIHVPENKITAGCPIVDLPAPREAVVTFSQHIGAIAVCCVKVGDYVERGQLIAKANGVVSANVHTPISGKVKSIGKWKTAFGYPCDTVTIVASEEDAKKDAESVPQARTDEEVAALTPDEIKDIVADAGVVGLGGAAFPTKVKLSPPANTHADVLIINGAECEPYLTNDHALMLACADEIIEGVRYIMRATGVKRTIIGIESNKKDAISLLKSKVAGDNTIKIQALKTKYPQGGEKQLIKALIGKEVPIGALPIAVGAIVQNVATAYAIYRAVRLREPLISRVLTVTGKNVKNPGNFHVYLGTPLKDVIEAAGGIPENTGKIIIGGPMMGRAIVSVDTPTIKGVSGLLFLDESEARRDEEEPCIRCGACVKHCPMGLEPYLLMPLTENNELELLNEHGVRNCIECGCCSYTCPSHRPLLDFIRLGKTRVNEMIRKQR